MYRRISNKVLSGPYASLNGKIVSWEETVDSVSWETKTGKIKVVGRDGTSFFVYDKMDCCSRWIIPGGTIRNVQVQIGVR